MSILRTKPTNVKFGAKRSKILGSFQKALNGLQELQDNISKRKGVIQEEKNKLEQEELDLDNIFDQNKGSIQAITNIFSPKSNINNEQ